MTIVDTTVWIDYLAGTANPHSDWLDREIGRQPLGLTDLILCELLRGIRAKSDLARTLSEFSAFDVFDSGGAELAVASARNYRFLRARGYTVRTTIDCLIATLCLSQGHALLHRDRDFDLFEQHLGLLVIHP